MASLSSESNSESFAILRIAMPPCASFPKAAVHEVRIRRNAPKIATANDSRSLFLKNVPVDSTEQHFRNVFTQLVGAGRFESITFEDESGRGAAAHQPFEPAQAVRIHAMARKRKFHEAELEEKKREEEREEAAARLPDIWTRRVLRSGSSAVVLLADDKSVQLVLKAVAKANKKRRYPVWENSEQPSSSSDAPPLGTAWIAAHLRDSRAEKAEVRRSIHAFFDAFNRREKEATELARRLRSEPDEDGFVTVARGGTSRTLTPASRREAEEARRRMVEREERKKAETRDFYRFQLRARRKDEQTALLRRFQQDKDKVNAMKERRGKFKPET